MMSLFLQDGNFMHISALSSYIHRWSCVFLILALKNALKMLGNQHQYFKSILRRKCKILCTTRPAKKKCFQTGFPNTGGNLLVIHKYELLKYIKSIISELSQNKGIVHSKMKVIIYSPSCYPQAVRNLN